MRHFYNLHRIGMLDLNLPPFFWIRLARLISEIVNFVLGLGSLPKLSGFGKSPSLDFQL